MRVSPERSAMAGGASMTTTSKGGWASLSWSKSRSTSMGANGSTGRAGMTRRMPVSGSVAIPGAGRGRARTSARSPNAGSPSTRPTVRPWTASAAARLAATVVAPSPPLADVTTMTCVSANVRNTVPSGSWPARPRAMASSSWITTTSSSSVVPAGTVRSISAPGSSSDSSPGAHGQPVHPVDCTADRLVRLVGLVVGQGRDQRQPRGVRELAQAGLEQRSLDRDHPHTGARRPQVDELTGGVHRAGRAQHGHRGMAGGEVLHGPEHGDHVLDHEAVEGVHHLHPPQQVGVHHGDVDGNDQIGSGHWGRSPSTRASKASMRARSTSRLEDQKSLERTSMPKRPASPAASSRPVAESRSS